jgi:hypothetical protein
MVLSGLQAHKLGQG